jgi:hypothetical protein
MKKKYSRVLRYKKRKRNVLPWFFLFKAICNIHKMFVPNPITPTDNKVHLPALDETAVQNYIKILFSRAVSNLIVADADVEIRLFGR